MKSYWLKKEDQLLTTTPEDLMHRDSLQRDLVRLKCGVRGHSIVPMSFLYAGQLKCACEWKQTFIAHG